MLRVSYKEHKTNDQVLCEANTVRKLFNKIRQRQCRFIDHVVHDEGMEILVTTGKLPGKRDRGRKRKDPRWRV
jgi:inosine/xanthosine triphosphate pyrophosphatase family protein